MVRAHDFLVYYRQLEQAIAAGRLASCHGVYRGGLAVHLAFLAMAGGLGLEVDLAGVAPNPLTALYAESAGRFLVTVAPTDRQAWEHDMAGAPWRCLGRVRADRRFVVRWGEQVLVQSDLADLLAAWQERFASLI